MKALVGAFNQEKALVGAFSVIVQPVVVPMDRFAALVASIIHTNLGDIDILKARVRMWNYLKCKLQIAIKGTNCSFNIEIDA